MANREDKIDKIINESINEFIINETSGRDTLKKIGGSIKNAVYNYMDRKSNGEWNTKYGKFMDYGSINANTKLSWKQEYRLCKVLMKWIDFHRAKLSNLLMGQDRNGGLSSDENESGNTESKTNYAEKYAKSYINVQNFENFTRKYFSAFEMPTGSSFENYITKLQKIAQGGNIGLLIRELTYSNFYRNFASKK